MGFVFWADSYFGRAREGGFVFNGRRGALLQGGGGWKGLVPLGNPAARVNSF